MPSDNENEKIVAYKEDPRIPCKYGSKCYQKNEPHHKKYKHPPKIGQTSQIYQRKTTTSKKRKTVDNVVDNVDDEEENFGAESRYKKHKVESTGDEKIDDTSSANVSDASENDTDEHLQELALSENDQPKMDLNDTSESEETEEEIKATAKESPMCSDVPLSEERKSQDKTCSQASHEFEKVIEELFLVKMPSDFYKFYDFCKKISKGDANLALKKVHLELVGPYDLLCGRLKNDGVIDKEKLLRHWRYYYDPPEFQTVIKVHDKDYLHFGYWRDEPSEMPIFVAKNKAKLNCVIEPVAENLFGLLETYLEEKEKAANPFERTSITHLLRQLKAFAKEHSIPLQKNTLDMRNREKKVVTRTFHKAGIVVPYNKKTQVGYRELAVTDKDLKKILKNIEEAGSSPEKAELLVKLEEVIRLATIAADECDFGTCLELGHDLFASGIPQVENKALQMLSIAYTHLQRQSFLTIIKAHLKDRKNVCDLSVI